MAGKFENLFDSRPRETPTRHPRTFRTSYGLGSTEPAINQTINQPISSPERQSWITHCACSYVTREVLALGSRMNSTRLDSITFKAFFRKTSQSTLCLLRFSAGQDMLTQEDKCLNWNSRLVEEVEVDFTRSLVCGVMWKFLVYRRFKTPTWEKLLISSFGSRFG